MALLKAEARAPNEAPRRAAVPEGFVGSPDSAAETVAACVAAVDPAGKTMPNAVVT